MKMVKRNRKSNAEKGMWVIVAAAMFLIVSVAIAKLVPVVSGLLSGNSVDRLDNTVGVNITEHYAPTIIKTDVDNNTCDLSIVVSREDLLRSIINMNQLGTSETVIQTFWLPNGKSFQFSTTKSNAEKALALMDAYLEDHPDLVSPPIENILNGIEETIASEENTEDTDEPTTTEAEESEAIESTEESQTNAIEESEAIETEEEASEATNETEKDTTTINLYARYNVRVDCQFPEDGQYDQYYAAFHDYDIAALHNYCQQHDLLNYTINDVKSNGAIWNVTISNYVFNNVQTEIDTNPKHASTFTVPIEMERIAVTTEPESQPESKTENDSPENVSENLDHTATDEDSKTAPNAAENEKSSIFTPVVIILAVIIAVLIFITIVLIIKIQSAKKRIQLIHERQEHDDYIDGEYEEVYEETEPEKPEEPQSDEPNEPDEPYGSEEASPTPTTSRPSTVDDFFANYINASKK